MQERKRPYEKPVLTDQGSVVTKTRANCSGNCWDGSPSTSCHWRLCPDT